MRHTPFSVSSTKWLIGLLVGSTIAYPWSDSWHWVGNILHADWNDPFAPTMAIAFCHCWRLRLTYGICLDSCSHRQSMLSRIKKHWCHMKVIRVLQYIWMCFLQEADHWPAICCCTIWLAYRAHYMAFAKTRKRWKLAVKQFRLKLGLKFQVLSFYDGPS